MPKVEGFRVLGSIARAFYSKSESFCEDALEILQDILHYNGYLRIWFDRDISFV